MHHAPATARAPQVQSLTRRVCRGKVQTLADDPATEKDTRQGGHTQTIDTIPRFARYSIYAQTEINPRLLHDIQALLSRLVG